MAVAKNVEAGTIFGKLTVVEEVEPHVYPNGTKRRKFKLLCECGSTTIANINNLKTGTTTSCGCARATHGMSDTRQYQCWADMKVRCDNPEHDWYSEYGGRGITYDPKWKTFEGFWEDMQSGYADNLTLNRVDNDGPYCKSNCEWAIMTDQNHNRRKRGSTHLSVIGGTLDVRDGKMYARIKSGTDTTCVHLGWYETEQEIAEAYDLASEIIYGDRPNKTPITRESVKSKVLPYLSRRGIEVGLDLSSQT